MSNALSIAATARNGWRRNVLPCGDLDGGRMYTVTITKKGSPDALKLDFDLPQLTIGRTDDNDIALQQNAISKLHAMVLVRDDHFVISDEGSTNGVYVRGERITAPRSVFDGDPVRIGDFTLTFSTSRLTPEPTPPPTVVLDKPKEVSPIAPPIAAPVMPRTVGPGRGPGNDD